MLIATLRAATRKLHTRAEKSGVVAEFLRGQASVRDYTVYLRGLWPVYLRMEKALLRNHAVPELRGMVRRDVFREPAIRADLTELAGPRFDSALPWLPEGKRYAERIDELSSSQPSLLLAHAYTRYLGDLNGGAVLARRLHERVGVPADALSFYTFGTDGSALAAGFAQAVDRATGEATLIGQLAEEAAISFELNIALSEAVSAWRAGAI